MAKRTQREHVYNLIARMAEEHVILIGHLKGASPSIDSLLEQHNALLTALEEAVDSLPATFGQPSADLVGRRMYFREHAGYGDLREPVTVTAEYQRGVRKYCNVVDAAGVVAHNVLAGDLKATNRGKLKVVNPEGLALDDVSDPGLVLLP